MSVIGRTGHHDGNPPVRRLTCQPSSERRGAWSYGDPYVRLLHMPEVQITLAVARVLREFLSDPSVDRYGYELMRSTSFPSGKLYPILMRLVRAGWLVREQEGADPTRAGRPSRAYYRLTAEGVEAARHALAVVSEQLTRPIGLGSLLPEAGCA